MQFVIINPATRKYERVNAQDAEVALAMARLPRGEVYRGVLMRLADGGGIGYVAHASAFDVPPAEQSYFSLNGLLMAGRTMLYQFDAAGQIVSLGDATIVTKFYDDAAHVEYLIAAGVLARPARNPTWRGRDDDVSFRVG